MANTITITIVQNTKGDGLTTTITKLGTLDKKVGGTIDVLGNLKSAMGNVAKVAAGVGFAGFIGAGVALGKAASAGFNFNNAMEQATAKINAFTKDGVKTERILEDIRLEAAKTPFEFEQMADAVSGLLPAAKQSGEAIMDLLKDAEVLAASNPAEGLEGAAFALREAVSGDFTSVIERFNLPRQMINELKEQGVPALEIVRRAMKDMGYDMDLVSAMANTAEGRWSTFKDTFTNLAGIVTQPLFNELSGGLGNLNTLLADNAPQLEAFAGMLAGEVSEAITTIATKTPEVIETITNLKTQITELLASFASAGGFGLAGLLMVDPETQEALKGIVDEAIRLKEVFMGGMEKGGAGGGFSAVFEDLKTQITEALPGLAADIMTGIPIALTAVTDGIGAFLRENAPDFQEAMSEWATTFWEWTNTIIEGAGTALAGILLSISAWATSDEAQTSLNETGAEIGKALQEGIGFYFENQGAATEALLKLAGGLLAGVAIITGDLIIIGGQVVAGILAGMLQSIGVDLQPATFNQLSQMLSDMAANLSTIASHVGEEIVKALEIGFKNAWTAFKSMIKTLIPTITPAFSDLALFILPIFEDTFTSIKDVWKPSKWFELGESVITGILEGIKKNQAEVLEMLKSLAADAIQAAKDAIGFGSPATEFMPIGESMVQGMLLGARRENFAKKFIDDLNMGGFARAAGTGGGQWRNFRNILKNEIGASFEQLMTSGMSAVEIMDKIRAVAHRFNFPPSFATEFAAANGLIEHLTSSVVEFQRAMRIENMGRMLQLGGQFSSIGQFFGDMFQGQLNAFSGAKEGAEKLKESISSLTDKLKEQQLKLATDKEEVRLFVLKLQDQKQAQDALNVSLTEAIATYGEDSEQANNLREKISDLQLQIDRTKNSIDEKNLAFEKLTSEIDKNQEALTNNEVALVNYRKELERQAFAGFDAFATNNDKLQSDLAMIEMLQDFLAGTGQEFRLIGEELGGVFAGSGLTSDIFHTRISAQEELNRLLAEQQQREEAITKQKELQEKLGFLQQQVELIKLGRELGGDIFRGMTFGLNASVEDLLAATNNVVEAMVNQINSDLQIASPSKVLFRIFRDQVGGAMVQGLAAARPALQGITGAMLDPLSGGGVNNSRTTNNYFNQIVNTRAETSSVIGDFRTMQLLAG